MAVVTKEIQKWADPAMFTAEPLKASDGPKVYLLWMTPDPLGAIAAACKMYKGEVVRSLSSVTDAERIEYFEQVQKTKLQAPFEFVQFHFMIEGVTRSFTHQMVRQRTAVYAQESLRFAVKEDMAEGVALPPSLAGTTGEGLKLRAEYPAKLSHDEYLEWSAKHEFLSDAEKHRAVWDKAVERVGSAYKYLVESGMPAEDARGLLPHNITTRLHYNTNLRALLDHAGNRLCTQAQFEWRAVFARMIEAIRDAGVSESFRRSEAYKDGPPVYMAHELASLFRPVCFQTGKCEFKANFDRSCKIRDRVDMLHENGIQPSEWETENYSKGGIRIDSIQPYEWLADPSAAR